MATLDQQYVNHLRKAARSTETTYVCALCKQSVPAVGKQGFLKHLDAVHSDEAARSTNDPNFDLRTWQDDIETQSRPEYVWTIQGHQILVLTKCRTSSVKQDRDHGSASQADNAPATQAMRTLTLDSTKKTTHRKIAPARTDQRPRGDPGGHKRSRSSEDNNQRQSTRSSKSQNPRRAGQKNADVGSPNQLNRAGTFQSNWGVDGQPTRQLFNPADGPPGTSGPTPAGQAALPSRNTAHTADASHPTPSATATVSTQPTQAHPSNQERGILPMPPAATRERTIAMPIDPRWPDMLLQPDSRPISQEQLAAEVKSIYSGLTMVESKCIHVDKAQALSMRKGDTELSHEHWQALIALHKTLLHEHHDFFLASQHPSASPALRRLAAKYTMPARMWKHGIHSFLELLRYRLPESLEFMISFIYTAYQMMSLLYETVPAFKNTWIECLGDLGRYRMAIEDEDIRDRENWANVSRFWYTKAADNTPETGRLYHHLAILARPNLLLQLCLYSRSLISVHIFPSARESILTLYNPFLGRSDLTTHVSPLDAHIVKASAILYTKDLLEEFQECQEGILDHLDQHISRITAKWREAGSWMIVSLLGALFDFGNDSPLRRAFDLGLHKLLQKSRAQPPQVRVFDPQQPRSSTQDTVMTDPKEVGTVDEKTQRAWDLAHGLTVAVTTLVLRRQGDKNVIPYVHIWLAFLMSLVKIGSADESIRTSYVANELRRCVPRQELCSFLNEWTKSEAVSDRRYESDAFIQPEKGESIPVPEDYLIRGQVWSQDYFPDEMFKDAIIDEEEKNVEHASTTRIRIERVLNIAYRLSKER